MFFLFIVFLIPGLFFFAHDACAKKIFFLEKKMYRPFSREHYRVFRTDFFENELSRVKIEYEKSASAFKVLNPGYDQNNIVPYHSLDKQKSSYIVFVVDDEDNRYVVKQEKNGILKKQYQSVCETLSAFMAEKVGISAHYVRILPIGMSFPGKMVKNQTATLHTLVPGVTVRNLQDNEYEKLDIKQKNDLEAGLPFSEMGFNRRVIANMAMHPALPPIVALDTLIGNRDRNRSNLIYDKKTFYAIDMALIYDTYYDKVLLAKLACDQVALMIYNKEKFNQSELEALKSYRKTLIALVSYFTPKRIYTLMHKIAFDAGLKDNLFFSGEEVFDMIYEYKCKIKESDFYIKKLIDFLSVLINGEV